ncbi:glycerol-3-phosphate dehydrogenase/oxidase [PVC group bacterium]|nr:glycerol-3-phosphate dehydrogenase/oxidase [PVC group bacterium]
MKRNFKKLEQKTFDLAVIGGGIYGVWAAYDAALRGLTCAVIDKGDWGSAASSASSKLIHGGLRYLEHFEFGLVRKSLIERERLLRLGPHRVRPLRIVTPVYKNGRVPLWKLKCGLWLYDKLSLSKSSIPTHDFLDVSETKRLYPHISDKNLQGAFVYSDASVDDFRLTFEILSGAVGEGAVAVNYAEATHIKIANREIKEIVVKNRLNNETASLKAKAFVLTPGPWLKLFYEQYVPSKIPLRLSKGVHLIMPKLSSKEGFLLTTRRDRRVIFLLPWYDRTILGTTDSDFSGNPSDVKVEPQDVDYLLCEANEQLPGLQWKKSDIQGSFAGVRALYDTGKKNPSDVSREWKCIQSLNNAVLSIGGKLTSAREDASVLVNQVCKILGRKAGPSGTKNRLLPWCPHEEYMSWRRQVSSTLASLGLDTLLIETLIQRYGIHVSEIQSLIHKNEHLKTRIIPYLPFCHAEFIYVCQNEMVCTLEDIMRRRIPIGILQNIPKAVLFDLATTAGHILGWDDTRQSQEVTDCFKRFGG